MPVELQVQLVMEFALLKPSFKRSAPRACQKSNEYKFLARSKERTFILGFLEQGIAKK